MVSQSGQVGTHFLFDEPSDPGARCLFVPSTGIFLMTVDPPYVLSTRGSARGVRQKYAVELTDDDHRRLACVLHDVRGYVVLSGHPSPLYDALYTGWERHERPHMADGAEPRTEVVWLNAACSRALAAERSQLHLIDSGGAA